MDYCNFKTCVKTFNQIVLTILRFSYYHRNIEFDNICHTIVIFTLKTPIIGLSNIFSEN